MDYGKQRLKFIIHTHIYPYIHTYTYQRIKNNFQKHRKTVVKVRCEKEGILTRVLVKSHT